MISVSILGLTELGAQFPYGSRVKPMTEKAVLINYINPNYMSRLLKLNHLCLVVNVYTPKPDAVAE